MKQQKAAEVIGWVMVVIAVVTLAIGVALVTWGYSSQADTVFMTATVAEVALAIPCGWLLVRSEKEQQ